MRDNTSINILEDNISGVCIQHIPPFDIKDYDLSNEKQLKKYLFDIEKICRNSYSYKKLNKFLREYIDMNRCSYMENVNNIESSRMRIHIHHAPLTLFDIVSTVYTKRVHNHEPLNINLVAKEVMYLHYMLLVGLIPLSETVHELVHNGYLFIPLKNVLGNYKEFIYMYKSYMDPQLLQTLEKSEVYQESYEISKEKVLIHDEIRNDIQEPGYLYSHDGVEDIIKNKERQ